MDDTNRARTLANLIIIAGGVAAAYAVFRSPSLRRAAWQLLKVGVTSTIPGIVLKEATAAWREAGREAA